MSSDDSSTRKSSKKRKSFEPDFNPNIRTYGNRSKKADQVVLVAEVPSSPKSPRISSPDARSKPLGSKKGETKPDDKSRVRDSPLDSPSESDSELNASSEGEPKGKKEAKKNKRSKSKQRELRSKKHEQSTSESSDDEDVSFADLSPRTKAKVLKVIKKGNEKKSKSQADPSVKPEKSNAKVKPETKHNRGEGSTQVLPKKEAHSIIVNYIRVVLFQLTGWKDMYNIQPSLEGVDDKGQPKCWESSNGDNKLRLRIEDPFDVNWELWGADFIRQWHDMLPKQVHSEFLSQVSDDTIRDTMKTVTWKSIREAWKRIQDGSEARNKKNIKSVELNRAPNKGVRRGQARKGTPFEGPAYNFLSVPEYLSPEASDAEDETRLVVDDPSHRSDLGRDIIDRLTEKSKSSSKRSTARKDKVVYVKVDTPLPKLHHGVRIQRWAIDNEYFKCHQEDIKRKLAYIDLDGVQPPDLTKFSKKYGKEDREYLAVRPRPKKARNEAPTVLPTLHHAKSTEPEPLRGISDSMIDPSMINNPLQNITESTVENVSPTGNTVSTSTEQPPKLLPYASTKTASELAAQYAAESAQRQSTNLDSPAFSPAIVGENAEMPSDHDNLTTSATTPRSKRRNSAAKSAAGASKTKPLTRAEQKKQAAGDTKGDNASDASGSLPMNSVRKMPTRLRVKRGRGF